MSLEGLEEVAPTMAAAQASEWQAGTVVWMKEGTSWVRRTTRRGGWQGLWLMMNAFCGGVNRKLQSVHCLSPTAPRGTRLTRMGYQDDLYLWGGSWQLLPCKKQVVT